MSTHDLGERLIAAFDGLGNFHLIFWNCQLFAKIFLQIICEEPVDFESWTASQITRFVNLSCEK